MIDIASCPLVDDAVAVAAGAARSGGSVLLGIDRTSIDVAFKDAQVDMTTSADRASQAAIVADLRATFPDHVIVGEEGAEPGADDAHVWYVDGLDGTSNYAHGIPWYAVSVALRCREHGADEVVAGAVFDPVHDQLFCAGRGLGATGNGEPLAGSAVAPLRAAVVVTQIQSADPARISRHAGTVERLLTTAGSVRSLGAPALVMAHIAAGHLGAYVERELAAWDVSAGQLLVEEAGGRVTDLTGARVATAAVTDVVASNGAIHDELLDALRGT
ncbi:inositol monophosphatase family protein [Pseudonocardia sp. CA-107938]|uniref:inositol monophosphatase family protein n=1 Tax=Pseudonocardia sp. CA-107938 TaxID=3240021 RepID=UPI003D8EDD37